METPEGHICFGEMNMNKQLHGKGVCVYRNGSFFEGWFYQGKRYFGRYISCDGYTFTGFWKDGRMNGRGIEGKLDGSPLSDATYRDGSQINDEGEPIGYKLRYDEAFEQVDLGMDIYSFIANGFITKPRLSQLITDPPMNKYGPHNHVFPLDSQFSFSNYIKVIFTN